MQHEHVSRSHSKFTDFDIQSVYNQEVRRPSYVIENGRSLQRPSFSERAMSTAGRFLTPKRDKGSC